MMPRIPLWLVRCAEETASSLPRPDEPGCRTVPVEACGRRESRARRSTNQPSGARIRGSERTAGQQHITRSRGYRRSVEEQAMVTVGVDIAKVTLEAAAWQDGRALRLGTFEQTAAGWAALRDAVAALRVSPTGRGRDPGTDPEPVAIGLAPTGGYELAFALWARQQDGWQVQRPTPARVRSWARSQGWRAKTDRQAGCAPARALRRQRSADVASLATAGQRVQRVQPVQRVGATAASARRRDGLAATGTATARPTGGPAGCLDHAGCPTT